MSREGCLTDLATDLSYPSALGSGIGLKCTSETIGIVSELSVPAGVEEEWLEGVLLPASAYSQSLRRESFVYGYNSYTVPTNPRRRKKGNSKPKSFKNPKMLQELQALEKRTDMANHMLGIMRRRILQSYM